MPPKQPYLYAGDLVAQQTFPGVVELVPVGFRHTGSHQGSRKARESRRLRRLQDPEVAARAANSTMWQPAGMMQQQPMMGQPMMQQPMMPMGQPMMQPMFGQPMMQQPMLQPMMQQPMMQQPAFGQQMAPPQMAPPPNPPVPDERVDKSPWPRKKDWAKPAWSKEQAEKGWKKGKKDEDDELAKGQWWEEQRTTRLILAVKLACVYGADMATQMLRWCSQCKQKEYVGADLCLTPGCRLPEA
jgi:hypothetical protein